MKKPRCRNIIVALLMMIFVGQSVASASISCQEHMSSTQESMTGFSQMDHSQHEGMMSDGEKDLSECCLESDCSTGGCIAAVLPASQQTFSLKLGYLASDYMDFVSNQFAVSLYRPPISR